MLHAREKYPVQLIVNIILTDLVMVNTVMFLFENDLSVIYTLVYRPSRQRLLISDHTEESK